MVKFPEAHARLYKNVFVCRRCKTKMKSDNMKILAKEVTCRKCNGRSLRPIKKK